MDLTYKIIGGDGAEYGPVAIDELKHWVIDGRVAPTTHVWRSDLAKWGPASEYAELQPELQQIAPTLEPAARPVGFWPRVGAYLIDVLVLIGIMRLVWGPSPEPFRKPPADLAEAQALLAQVAPFVICQFLVEMGYHVFFNGQFGATLGKLAIGARIVNADGSRIGFGKALVRFVARLASWPLTLGIGYLFVGVREDKRALHDLLARTKVIYRR